MEHRKERGSWDTRQFDATPPSSASFVPDSKIAQLDCAVRRKLDPVFKGGKNNSETGGNTGTRWMWGGYRTRSYISAN